MTPFATPEVKAKFDSYAPEQRVMLLSLRELVFDTANATAGVGRIEETLKWGQPSYLTPETRSGSTIRIDAHPGGGVAIYVNCQTDLVERFRRHYPKLNYEGVRAVVFGRDARLPDTPLRHMIALALTYHSRKKAK